MLRILDGRSLRSNGEMSISQLAQEAGLGRHVLYKHIDLKTLFQQKIDQLAADRQQPTPSEGCTEAPATVDLRNEVEALRVERDSLATQLAAALLRLDELEDRRRRGASLRSVDP